MDGKKKRKGKTLHIGQTKRPQRWAYVRSAPPEGMRLRYGGKRKRRKGKGKTLLK